MCNDLTTPTKGEIEVENIVEPEINASYINDTALTSYVELSSGDTESEFKIHVPDVNLYCLPVGVGL